MTKVKSKAKTKSKSKTKEKAKPKKLRARSLMREENAHLPEAKALRNKGGRPRTTINDLPKNWEKIMISLADKGKGVTAWMVNLDIERSALNTLLEDSDQFRYIYEKCKLRCKLWHEDIGNGMMKGKAGSAAVWTFVMSNKFGYVSHKHQLSGDRDNPVAVEVTNKELTDDELKKQLVERGLPTTIFDE